MSEHQANHETESKSHSKRHSLMMVLCCLMPMILVVALLAVFPGSSYLSFVAFMMCPLAMLLMYIPKILSRKKKT